MKEVRNNPEIDSNAPAKDTKRHPKRSHNALDIGPKKKFKPMAMAPIQAMERNKSIILMCEEICYCFCHGREAEGIFVFSYAESILDLTHTIIQMHHTRKAFHVNAMYLCP